MCDSMHTDSGLIIKWPCNKKLIVDTHYEKSGSWDVTYDNAINIKILVRRSFKKPPIRS